MFWWQEPKASELLKVSEFYFFLSKADKTVFVFYPRQRSPSCALLESKKIFVSPGS